MAIKVGMVSLGCPKNQMDAELMLAKLRAAGFTLTPESGLADVVIVNTCGFIEDAKKEAIENILEFAQLKKEGQIKRIIVTGCLAERYREPECDAVLGLGANGDIVAAVRQAMNGKTTLSFPDKACWELDGDRVLTTPGFYAYLRIGDGCDNRCAYCAIPLIRGRMRSRRMETLVEEARWLAKKGVKELVLVAQDTTLYGKDLYGELKLPELLRLRDWSGSGCCTAIRNISPTACWIPSHGRRRSSTISMCRSSTAAKGCCGRCTDRAAGRRSESCSHIFGRKCRAWCCVLP